MIPSYIHPFLWSYDVDKLDLSQNKKRIITNILNFGDTRATDWLFKTYKEGEIKKMVSNPLPGEWNKKSLGFWRLVLGVRLGETGRRVALNK